MCVVASSRLILQANYGRKDSAAEARVKEVFLAVGLPAKFEAYEQESYARLTKLIDSVDESTGLRKAVLTEFLSKVYKRGR